MIPVAEQRARVLAAVAARGPLPTTIEPLATATGRLAHDVHALVPIPPWDNSAMDGYAVRSADLPPGAFDPTPGASHGVTLHIVADVPAGSGDDPALGPGQAARIMTGAPMPTDADTVVQLEHTDRDDPTAPLAATVTVLHRPTPGMHVRRAGEDREIDDLIARAGTRLNGPVRSALASAGHGTAETHRPPRVAVVATGSELLEPGTPLHRGLIPDSNSLLLADLVTTAGGTVTTSTRVGDDPADLAALLATLTLSQGYDIEPPDIVILTGGVSEGAFDPVKRLFGGSSEVTFAKVAMQPGKPQAFGVLPGGTLLFGLPGNPVSVWVSFHVFVLPALLALQGHPHPVTTPFPARAGSPWRTPPGREQYLPARIAVASDATLRTSPVARRGSGSHLVGSLADANGYAVVPVAGRREDGRVEEGDPVEVVLTAPLAVDPPAVPDQPSQDRRRHDPAHPSR